MAAGILKSGRYAPVVFLLLVGMADVRTVEAQSSGVTPDRFVGGWVLVDWRATDSAGNVRFPYGENAQGQIMYSSNGRMSAHLMRPPENPADAPPQHLAYWGRFTVQAEAGTVTHHVVGADANNWIGSDQVRGFEFQGPDRLILSAGTNRLTWERAR